MADKTTLNPGTGGDDIATDDLGAFGKVQWVKLADGTNGGTGLIAGDATNGLDVDVTRLPSLPAGANAIGKLAANSGVDIGDVDVTSTPGTVADGAAGLPAVLYVVGGWDGTNVQALATDSSGLLQVDVATAPTTAVTGPLTDAQLRATPVPVSGTVTASGPLTDTQLRATAVPVSGPLTDAQLRATAVPVSGTVTASGPLTDTQLRATAVPVSGTVTANLAAGTNNIGDVDVLTLPSIPAGNNNIGDVDVLTLPALVTGTASIGRVNVEPQTANGLSIFHLVSAASTNATNVKASGGQMYGWYIYNSNAAARKVAFHNTAGTPTAGASVVFSIVIPPTSAANVEFTNGLAFGTGIAITTVTELTDAGTTGVAASDLVINLFFK